MDVANLLQSRIDEMLTNRELSKVVRPTMKFERLAAERERNKNMAAKAAKGPVLPAPFDPFAATDRDRSAAATLIKGLRTPIQEFSDSVKDMYKLLLVGAIDKGTFKQGLLQARGTLAGAMPAAGTTGAIEYGTQAHYAAEAMARSQEMNRQHLANLVREAIVGNRLHQKVLDELRKRKDEGDNVGVAAEEEL